MNDSHTKPPWSFAAVARLRSGEYISGYLRCWWLIADKHRILRSEIESVEIKERRESA